MLFYSRTQLHAFSLKDIHVLVRIMIIIAAVHQQPCFQVLHQPN